MDTICLRGARMICEAVGENHKEIVSLVRDKGLPAWKREEKGTWRALPEDLRRWVKGLRDANLPPSLSEGPRN